MTAASNYLETRLLMEYLVDTPPFIALHAQIPTDNPEDPANAEVSGGMYQRQQAAFNVIGGTATLANDMLWTGMPDTMVRGISIWDAPIGGNMLIRGALVAAKTVGAGDAFALPASNVTVNVD